MDKKIQYMTFAVVYGFFLFMFVALVGTLFNINIAPLCLLLFIVWMYWNIRFMNKDFPKWEKFIKNRMAETKKLFKNGFEAITNEKTQKK